LTRNVAPWKTKPNSKNFLSKPYCLIVRNPNKWKRAPRKFYNTRIFMKSLRLSQSSLNIFITLHLRISCSPRRPGICRRMLIRCWMLLILLTIFILILWIEAVMTVFRCALGLLFIFGMQIPLKYVSCLTLPRRNNKTTSSTLLQLNGNKLVIA
jgi:hypothetical protein